MNDPEGFQRRILESASLAQAVDVRPFELDDSGDVESGLLRPVIGVLENALALYADTLDTFDRESDETSGSNGDELFSESGPTTAVVRIVDDEARRQRDAVRQVADVAFLGITEARHDLDRITRLPPGIDRWEAVAEGGGTLHRVVRSLTALEAALCRLGDLEPRLECGSQLSSSLEVRRQYQRLRQACDVTPTDDALERAARRVGTAIAVLVGKSIYPELRILDRRQLRSLQQRILAWLMLDHRDPSWHREGRRLWDDLSGFSRLISNVSRRQELVEYDSKVIARAYEELTRGAPEVSGDLFAELSTLIGLDREVDQLLADDTHDASAWRPVVLRLHRELNPFEDEPLGRMGTHGA